jgi:hypothetical protein
LITKLNRTRCPIPLHGRIHPNLNYKCQDGRVFGWRTQESDVTQSETLSQHIAWGRFKFSGSTLRIVDLTEVTDGFK